MDIGPGVGEVIESAMFVVGETVDLDASCFPRVEYACAVTSANGVKCKFGALCGRGDGTADGGNAASVLLGDANGCDERVGVNAR